MPTFLSNGIELYFETHGEGRPLVLVHGFASDLRRNWKDVGWFHWMADAGFEVIALDARGHGKSAKLHDTEDYTGLKMAEDVVNLIDHLGLDKVCLMGYSMGGMISTRVVECFGDRIEKAVLAGVGGSMVTRRTVNSSAIADAMVAESVDEITDPGAKGFRIFADASGADRLSLAAYMRAGRPSFEKETLAKVEVPILVVAGERDDLVGDPGELATCFPNGRAVVVPRRDHLNTVGDRVYRDAVIEFLSR